MSLLYECGNQSTAYPAENGRRPSGRADAASALLDEFETLSVFIKSQWSLA